MNNLKARLLVAAAVMVALLGFVAPGSAQQFLGRIEVTVQDATGAVLPGVNVELTGPVNRTTVTDGRGEARFLNLSVGTYQVRAILLGFNEYKNTNVVVVAGGAVPLMVKMTIAGTRETVLVMAESPIIDRKKTGTATNVTLEELQNIPSARDPWVVMQTVPGIIVDRVNVGGSESGQQSGYQAKGASGADATWSMDGIPITDMAATGSTPTYYDFDMFQEMNVTTGGSDMTSATGGVHLNFILKSGTDRPHGSARVYFENQRMQSNNMDPTLATNLDSPNGKGNRTDQYADYGFEVGGPLFRDRLWGWGSLGKTDVRILTIKQTPDRTILENRALKVHGQVSSALRAAFTYFYGNKLKYGRDASATRPPETTYNEKGPSSFYKGEVNYVFGNSLFLTGRFSHFPTGFRFDPQGGMDKQVWQDDGGVWHGSYWNHLSDRPQQTVVAEGSYFRGAHEFRFGFSWRRVTVDSTSALAGNKTYVSYIGAPDFIVYAVSDWASKARAHYSALWLADTISFRKITLNAGIRVDMQDDGTLETKEAGVPGFEQWLPAISAKPIPKAITWNSASPRVSASCALNESRKTLLRGSYAMFSSQLGNGASSIVSPVQYRYVAFYGRDLNGDHVAQANEIYFDEMYSWTGFDIDNPSNVESVNRTGSYTVPRTNEVIVGFDHEIFANFGVSAAFTWRKMTNFNWQPRIGLRASNYVQGGSLSASGLPDGSSVTVPYYVVPDASVPASAQGGGVEYVSRDGYHQRFWGFEVVAQKRLSDKWMARVGFSTNKHQEYFDDPKAATQDPTSCVSCPANTQGGPLRNGGLVVVASGGSGKSNVYQLLPAYQMTANGMYQAPWGIGLGVNWTMRQGFGQPWFQSHVPVSHDYFNKSKAVLLNLDVGKNRLPTVSTVDIRVGKVFRVKRANLSFDFDIFNLFNSGTVLGRQYDRWVTGATGFNQVLEIMNPRIARVGLRFGF